jgi:hypothetical protein
MLAAVAALVAAGASSTLQVRCQTKGLDLARVLLANQPAWQADMSPAVTTTTTSSSSSSGGSGGGASCPVSVVVTAVEKVLQMEGVGSRAAAKAAWRLLLAALGALFARYLRDPMSLTNRQLLHTACLLLGELVQQERPSCSTPQAAAVAAAQGTDSAGVACPPAVGAADSSAALTQEQQPQQEEEVLQGLRMNLRVLHQDLITRKLARSSSREELLQAVGDALELLDKLGSKPWTRC